VPHWRTKTEKMQALHEQSQRERWPFQPPKPKRTAMQNIGLILLVFAFVLACLAAYGVGRPPWHLGWAAVALWIASELIGGIGRAWH